MSKNNFYGVDLGEGAAPIAPSVDPDIIIDVSTQITGDLPIANFDGGINADASKFWRGDGVWAVPPSSGGGDITYSNASAVPVTVGGIVAGSTFTDATFTEMMDQLLYPFQSPSVTLLVVPSNYLREYGDTIASVDLTANITVGTNPIVDIIFERGVNPLQSGLLETYHESNGVSSNTTFNVFVTDGDAGEDTASKTYSFVYPFYYGVGAPGLSAASIAGLTKLIQTNGDKTLGFAPTNQVYYFAVPASYGALNDVIDWNGFSIGSDFTIRTEDIIGLDGSPQSYRIYEFNNLVTHTTQNLVFDT